MFAVSSRTAEVLSLLRRPQLAVWALFILTMPIYVARGGLPKPADALIIFLFPLALVGWRGRLDRSSVTVFRALFAFTIWVCVVNVAWMAILGASVADALYPVYYVYNAAVFLIALVLFERFGEKFLRLTVYVFYVAIFWQVAASFVYRGSSYRNSLFFDNPNQLGYYALLVACIISLSQRRLGFSTFQTAVGLTGCGYLAVISASRSAVSGIAVLVVLLVFSNPRVIVLASVVALGLFFVGGPVATAIDSMEQRAIEKHNPDPISFFTQRGYDRIVANKEHLILGAGEQAYSRFADTTIIGRAEIHSSLGTIVFSYGLVGIALFTVFLNRLVRGVPLRAGLILVAPLLYTVAHQGLRFTTLWILLALFVALKAPVVDPARPRRVPLHPSLRPVSP